MKSNSPSSSQSHFSFTELGSLLDPKHELYVLSKKFPWDKIEKEFSDLYSHTGRPAKPVRLMVGLILLKHYKNLGDETVVKEWVQNPYFQFFCGEQTFQWKFPCEPSDLVHFRKRIGESGIEFIFKSTIGLHRERSEESDVVIDTTVEEKNVCFPTDPKLHMKIIQHVRKIASNEDILLRQSYQRVAKQYLRDTHNAKHPKRAVKARRSKKKLHTIAWRLVREIVRKLEIGSSKMKKYADQLMIFQQILDQKKSDSNKIYSIHESQIYCISKGKDHKLYEFGNKVSIASCKESGVIVGAQCTQNQYDGHTLPKVIQQINELRESSPKRALVDRGYKGKNEVDGVQIIRPGKKKKGQSDYQTRKLRKDFRKRAAIEPRISHLKHHHRLLKNFYKGEFGDKINVMLAAAAYNLRLFMLLPLFILWSVIDFETLRKNN